MRLLKINRGVCHFPPDEMQRAMETTRFLPFSKPLRPSAPYPTVPSSAGPARRATWAIHAGSGHKLEKSYTA